MERRACPERDAVGAQWAAYAAGASCGHWGGEGWGYCATPAGEHGDVHRWSMLFPCDHFPRLLSEGEGRARRGIARPAFAAWDVGGVADAQQGREGVAEGF
jgi:hypothetical protein